MRPLRALLVSLALLSTLLTGCARPTRSTAIKRAPTADESPIRNPFGSRLLRTIEYIDYADVLTAVAENNPQPWRWYEGGEAYAGRTTTLEDRWNQAIAQDPSGQIDSQLLEIIGIFTEGKVREFRGYPIDDAGGDLLRDAWGHGYDRLTLEQFAAVANNPLLAVETRPDTLNTGNPGETVLVRYRYPSAGTWKQFADLLSADLNRELQAAEASGQLNYDIHNPKSVSPIFQRLTRKILSELLRSKYDPTAPAWLNYQKLISVHPFSDYNGRSLRAWYRHQVRTPLFMLDFNCDLYCSPERFKVEVEKGLGHYQRILSGLQKEERTHPQSPLFYDIPAFWVVAAGLPSTPADEVHFVSMSKTWFRDPKNVDRIRQKQFTEVFRDFAEYVRAQRISSGLPMPWLDWRGFLVLGYGI